MKNKRNLTTIVEDLALTAILTTGGYKIIESVCQTIEEDSEIFRYGIPLIVGYSIARYSWEAIREFDKFKQNSQMD